jgi:hypothetical protein
LGYCDTLRINNVEEHLMATMMRWLIGAPLRGLAAIRPPYRSELCQCVPDNEFLVEVLDIRLWRWWRRSEVNQDPALIGRVGFDMAIEFLQVRLREFGENPPFELAGTLTGNYLEQRHLLCDRAEYGAANSIVDLTIASEDGVQIHRHCLQHPRPPEFEVAA